jgi:hypothetical protein
MPGPSYDPWRELAASWPEVEVRLAPLGGRLLGELRYPVITLRAGTSAAQRRCTLAHEIVHLERGGGGCGPWAAREERLVHREAARRLITSGELRAAIAELGPEADRRSLARALEVDRETLVVRLQLLSEAEWRQMAEVAARAAA